MFFHHTEATSTSVPEWTLVTENKEIPDAATADLS
jgi:hypothetical protein